MSIIVSWQTCLESDQLIWLKAISALWNTNLHFKFEDLMLLYVPQISLTISGTLLWKL